MHPGVSKMTVFTRLQIPSPPISASSSTPTLPVGPSPLALSPEAEAHVISELLDPEAKMGLARREALLEVLSAEVRGAVRAQIRRELPVGFQGKMPLTRRDIQEAGPGQSERK